MKLLIGLLLATSAFAIDGTVHNGTTDKPQPGATVSLFRITQNGPEMLTSVKSGADGSFQIANEDPGPRLLQAAYGGVTYNKMIPPGTSSDHLQIDVFNSTSKQGDTRIGTHMMLVEPAADKMVVSESFVYTNNSKLTYSDPDKGTLHFYLPPESQGKVEVNVLAPGSVAVRRPADKTSQPNIYKVDFPIKPGESRIDISYEFPFATPGTFSTHVLFPKPNTKIIAPTGVTLTAPGMVSQGQEPRTQATIYSIDGADLKIGIQGTGSLRQPQAEDSQQPQSEIQELMPQLYKKVNPADGLKASAGSVKWILVMIFGILALAFTYLYRKQTPDGRGR